MAKLLKWLIYDLHLKIIAILVTIAFWVYVALDHNYEMTLNLNIRTKNLKENLILASDLPNVWVTFSGKGRELLKLKIKQPWITLNLAQAHIGENSLPLTTQNINTPPADIVISKISHKELDLLISEKAEKYITPTVITQGEPKSGFALKDIQSNTRVKIIGPKERIQHIKEILTEPLSLSNQSSSFSKFIALNSPADNSISIFPCSTFVQITIEEAITRVFTKVPIHIITPPGATAQIEPPHIESLAISGPRSIIATSSLEDFSITIDLRGRFRGRHSLPAEIRLPRYLKLVESRPKLFNITLR